MIAVLLLVAHVIGMAGYNVLLRKSALSSVNKYFLAALMNTALSVPALIFIFSGNVGFRYDLIQWATLIASAGAMVAVQLGLVLALKYLEASVWSIIFNLRLVLTTIFGFLFLQELPPIMQILGGLVIFVSVLALNLHKNKHYSKKALAIGCGVTLLFSIHATIEKYNVVNVGFEDYMLISGNLASLALWVLVWYKKVPLVRFDRMISKQTTLLLFMRILSAWTYVYALAFVPLAVAIYVSGMSAVLVVIFGIVFLHERAYLRQKILATCIAATGLTMIFIGKF